MESQGPIQIPGAPGWWQETTARYDYAQDKSRCPICGGVGIPWAGYFHCDGFCHAIAVVEDGRTFLPVKVKTLREGLAGEDVTGREHAEHS